MKIIERVVEATHEPNKNDLWLKPGEEGSATLNRYAGGQWRPIGGSDGSSSSEPVYIDVKSTESGQQTDLAGKIALYEAYQENNLGKVFFREIDAERFTIFLLAGLEHASEPIDYYEFITSDEERISFYSPEALKALYQGQLRYREEFPISNIEIDTNTDRWFIESMAYQGYEENHFELAVPVTGDDDYQDVFMLADMDYRPIVVSLDYGAVPKIPVVSEIVGRGMEDDHNLVIRLTEEEIQSLVGVPVKGNPF